MKKKNILPACCIVLACLIVIPLIVSTLAPKCNSEITADGLLGYIIQAVSAVGTISLAAVAVWQNRKYKEENDKLQAQHKKDEIEHENLSSEHPQLLIEKVELLNPFGNKLKETYERSDKQDNCFWGKNATGVLKITVRNIGNGILLNMQHRGIDSFQASHCSKTIPANATGEIRFFLRETNRFDDYFQIKYQNLRGFQYQQALKIVGEEIEHFDFKSDCNGEPDFETAELVGTETTVYVILENKQTLLGFMEEQPDGTYEI